jgi:bisphosphoglycerate-dependent phosphoglycerate mutase
MSNSTIYVALTSPTTLIQSSTPPTTLYFMRHGLSCANVIEKYNGHLDLTLPPDSVNIEGYYAPNAVLTTFTINNQISALRTKIGSNDLPKPDIVITSELNRAMQTGYELFKNNQINFYISSYINEERVMFLKDKQNMSSEKEIDNFIKNNINNNIQNKTDIKKYYDKNNLNQSNFYDFYNNTLKKIIGNKKGLNIYIVTHGDFLKKLFKYKKDINNLDVFKVNYDKLPSIIPKNYTITEFKYINLSSQIPQFTDSNINDNDLQTCKNINNNYVEQVKSGKKKYYASIIIPLIITLILYLTPIFLIKKLNIKQVKFYYAIISAFCVIYISIYTQKILSIIIAIVSFIIIYNKIIQTTTQIEL